jgi:acyl-CoA ligase (AMP-forming) (exosortase A-associated)
MKPFLVQHLLRTSALRDPDKVALQHGDETKTFQELATDSDALAAGLQSMGIESEDRVGILLDKSIRQVTALLATLRIGAIFVLINTQLKEDQIRHILDDCGIKLIIASPKYRQRILNVRPQSQIEKILWDSEFEQVIQAHSGKTPAETGIGEDAACIIYTSGSTGRPKGIVISHRNLIEGAHIVCSYVKITASERILGLLPLNFDYGLNQLMSTFHMGCTLILFQFFMPNSLLTILERERITGLPAIPTIWSTVFNPRLCRIDPDLEFPDLRYITNTGGKLPVPIVKRIRQMFPSASLFLMYGLTEAFRSTYLEPREVDRRPDSIGKAIPNTRVDVVDEEGRLCRAGEIGELIHAGACVSKGYWNNREMTARVFRPNPLILPGNGHLEHVVYSGDLVKKDRDGFLYYVGRKDSMIKKGGYRISPTEIEEVLLGHPNVAEAVAFGVERQTGQTLIVALLTINSDIDIESLSQYFRRAAPEYLLPDRICILDHFIRTETGKIDRPRVIQEARTQYDC